MEKTSKASQFFRKKLFQYKFYSSKVTSLILQSSIYDFYLKNPISTSRLKKTQFKLLKKNYASDIKKLIIIFSPGYDDISGGILSISSIYAETDKMHNIHHSDVLMCNLPGDPSLLQYTKFSNNNFLYNFSQIIQYFNNLEKLIMHLPEYSIGQFLNNLSSSDYDSIQNIDNVHINILLQNIDYLPSRDEIKSLKNLGDITCTTAHEKYSNQKMREKIGLPLHKLSVFISPENYQRKPYVERENLMIISPDPHPCKSRVLDVITDQIPELKLQIINNLSYEDFKDVISRAKWSLTFGEGLDGYFVETIFSGGIGFSVYNSQFFTGDFKDLKTVYPSYKFLINNLISDIKILDNEKEFEKYQKQQYGLCTQYWDYEDYIKNLELFYEDKYTYI